MKFNYYREHLVGIFKLSRTSIVTFTGDRSCSRLHTGHPDHIISSFVAFFRENVCDISLTGLLAFDSPECSFNTDYTDGPEPCRQCVRGHCKF